MGNGMVGAIALGTLLVAGAAMAQTAGPSVGPVSPGIVPVTGPSTVPSLPDPVKPVAAPGVPVGKGETGKVAGARVDSVSRASVATRPAAQGVKVVHKPGAKATAKKVPAPKHVAKAAGSPAKTKRVAIAKRQAPVHQATVSKPIPLTKHQPPANRAAPAQPVLPRV